MANARSRITISGIDDKSGHVALFRCSSPVRNPLQSESLCRCFLRAFTRQLIGSTVAVFARSANCGFLLTANAERALDAAGVGCVSNVAVGPPRWTARASVQA